MAKTEVRPATREDMAAYSGKTEVGPSFKAIAGLVDDKVVAVAGIAFRDGIVWAFCDLKDEARPFKHRIHRVARRLIDEAKQKHRFIYCECDADEPGAARWLRRLGFKHVGNSIWRLTSKP